MYYGSIRDASAAEIRRRIWLYSELNRWARIGIWMVMGLGAFGIIVSGGAANIPSRLAWAAVPVVIGIISTWGIGMACHYSLEPWEDERIRRLEQEAGL